MLNRREFVKNLGVAAAAPLVMPAPTWLREWSAAPAGSSSRIAAGTDLDALARLTLVEAERLGCRYAEVAVTRRRTGSMRRGPGSGAMTEAATIGVALRVVHSEGWGAVEQAGMTPKETARRAVESAKADAAHGERNPMCGLAHRTRTSGGSAQYPSVVSEMHRKAFRKAVRRHGSSTVHGEEICFRSTRGRLIRSATVTIA